MTISLTTRPMSPDDLPRRTLHRRADEIAWVLAPAPALGAVGAGAGVAARWLLARFGVAAPGLPAWAGLAALAVGLCFTAWLASRGWRAERLARTELVEVLHVRDAPYVVGERDPVPALMFDLDGSRALFVSGAALDAPRAVRGAHGADPRGDGPLAAFPSTQFALHRGATSGRLIRIEVLGRPLAPAASVPSVVRLLRGRVAFRDLKETLVVELPCGGWSGARR